MCGFLQEKDNKEKLLKKGLSITSSSPAAFTDTQKTDTTADEIMNFIILKMRLFISVEPDFVYSRISCYIKSPDLAVGIPVIPY